MKRRLNTIRLDKIAAVDRPCQEHATVAIVKRAPGDPKLAIAKASFSEALNGAMVSEKVNEAFWDSFDGLWQRNDAFRTALTDELSDGGDGSAASADYIDSVNSLVEEAVAAARSAGSSASDAELEKAITEAATSWIAKKQPKSQEQKMTNITTKALLKSAVASFDPAVTPAAQIAVIQKAAQDLDAVDELPAEGPLAVQKADPSIAEMQKELAVLKMPEDIRKHYEALAEKDQADFIAKSAADQRTEVDAANATDPVLYKSASGLEIRKSDGNAALMLAKQLDEQTAEIVKLRDGRAESAIEKSAARFPNVSSDVSHPMLKSVQTVGAETDAGKAILKTLDQMNKAQTTLFKNLGTVEGGDAPADIQKARNDFNAEVSKVAARDNIPSADAMSKVRAEMPELYKEAYPQPEGVEE